MPHSFGDCVGWSSGPYPKDASQCRICWKKQNPATERDDGWTDVDPNAQYSTLNVSVELKPEAPLIRTPCLHLGVIKTPCGCGNPLLNIHQCECDAQDKYDGCWRSPIAPPDDKPFVTSCEKCTYWTPGFAKPTVQQLASAIGVSRMQAVVINLNRRFDRYGLFQTECLIDGVERFEAVDAYSIRKYMPRWWKNGEGAFGCYLSHHAVIKQALTDGLDNDGAVLVFEDDAVFSPSFAGSLMPFLKAVPSDAQQIYLGGQHLDIPWKVSPLVYRARHVNRAHAYILKGAYIRRFHEHLEWCNETEDQLQHVDFRMGMLHSQIKCYTPSKWLIGQRGGTSDIGPVMNGAQWWD